jgi:serine protease AprX
VAGLIAGNSLALDKKSPDYGRYMGIAPDADLISVKVADEGGNATVLDVIYGLQFAVDRRRELNIRLVNLSLSSTVAESYRTDPLDAAVEQAWLKGIVVVAAAGNEGRSKDAVSYAPANDPFVITAGAVDDQGTRIVADDRIANWSSRGVTRDGFTKPEVLAPGAGLVSALAPASVIAEQCPECLVGDRYLRLGGTSMSAAVVSGASALLIDKHPDWSPNQVKGALQSTLQDVPGVGGEVDALAALHARQPSSNAGLTTNALVDQDSGEIDWARASFRRASFRDAAGSELGASWSRASFRCDCSLAPSGAIDPERASFRRASFRRTMSFAK